MLAVVHDQQQFLVPQVRKHKGQGLGRGLVPQVQSCQDGAGDKCRVMQLGELDQPPAAAEAASEICRCPDRQACLADPARADEADQAGLGELLPDFRELTAAADETARLGWQVARAPGGSSHDKYLYGCATGACSLGTRSVIPPMPAARMPSYRDEHV